MYSSTAHNNTSEIPVNIVDGTHGQLVLFLFFNIWPSHLGLPILAAIVLFSKKVRRHPTFTNLCFAFIITGISSSLLAYSGNTEGPEPPKVLCLLQASLLYGMPALASLAVLALVLRMFLGIRAATSIKVNAESAISRWAMLSTPWIAWMICILATVIVGTSNPEKVSRNRRFFYCSIESNPLTNTIMIATACILFATLMLEVWSILLVYRRHIIIRENASARNVTELDLYFRIIAFGLYVVAALSISLLSIKSPYSPVPDLIIASAATIVILIFGTRRELLKAACFWESGHIFPDGSRVN